jgi:N-hydroxyarylamine O-acetyltransferase
VAGFDLDAYLERIRWRGERAPTLATLASLMRAHITAIPFENLDVLLGLPVRLDLDSIVAKLVAGRRGGYCFEHGTLFHAALERFGYRVQAHAARVVMLTPRSESPRTHMFLTVEIAGSLTVVDPGFGGQGPLVPLPLVDGTEVREGADCHRFVRDGEEWVLQAQIDGRMVPLWTSRLEAQYPIDFVLSNHYVSTYPDSPFVNRLMLRAITPEGRTSVMNADVTVRRASGTTKYQLADRAALRALLERDFGIHLPEVDQLRVPSIPEWK